ncbi:eta DNA polymerase [Coprinopsis cinerea AmutBmut pab1-1]|nr:eta DNA polymerase [Coprinopsis cinerea AmutBmut pab1-1]
MATSASIWKGKGKAATSDSDFTDLNPTITYRHLLSQNLGVRDPLRVVGLCDSDAFYAACEMVRLGVDKDTPLVVLQWDSLIAVNYPARKYGISRMDKKKDALKRCPHLKVVHVATYKEGEKEPGYWDNVDTNTHKVSLDYYRRESMKIAALFRELLPGCEVEKASIDEAFIDFTKPVREVLLQRYPYLAQVPPDAPNGVDTPLPPPPPISWYGTGDLIPINPVPATSTLTTGPVEGQDQPSTSKQQPAEEAVHDEGLQDGEDANTTWHDVALSIAAGMVMKARKGVLEQLGYSTSAGLARNKFLAKLAASYRKPFGQNILRNAAIPNYLIPMAFQKIRFLGGKLGRALAQEYDAATVGDLLSISLDEMQNKFGEDSIWVYEILRGIDRSEVKDKGTTLTKSMLASKNLPKPITAASEGYHWIRVLAAELALRLNEARQISPNLWPKNIVLHARKGSISRTVRVQYSYGRLGYESSRSKQAVFPFTREVTVDTVAAAGDKLWKELVGNATTMKISSVQLSFTGIDVSEPGQQSIEGFFKSKPPSKRQREDDHGGTSTLPGGDENEHSPSSRGTPGTSFTCPRCNKTLSLNPEIQALIDDGEREAALASLKLEHDDWHFARDLAQEDNRTAQAQTQFSSTSSTAKKSLQNKKRRKVAVGIEKFFDRKS